MEDFKPFSLNDDEKEKKYDERNIRQHVPYVHYVTATGGTRIAAYVLDVIFCIFASIPLFVLVGLQTFKITSENYLKEYFSIIGYTAVIQFVMQFLIPLFSKGKTIGKACLHLRIISTDGSYANVGQLFFRSTVYTVIPIIEQIPVVGQLIGLVMFIFWIISLVFIFQDSLNQSLHDKMSDVVVIDEYKTKALQNRRYEDQRNKERNYDDGF